MRGEGDPRYKISRGQRIGRKVALIGGHNLRVFNWTVENGSNSESPTETGWEKTQRLAQEGYGALIVVRHATKAEMQRYIGTMFATPAFADKPVVAPIATHQAVDLYDKAGKLVGTQLPRIHIDDTDEYIKKNKDRKPEKVARLESERENRQGMRIAYGKLASDTLRQGGVVITSATEGRRPFVTEMDPTVTGLLLATDRAVSKETGKREPINNIVIVTATFDMGNVDFNDEKVAKSLHPFKNLRLRFGDAYTKEELTQKIAKLNKDRDPKDKLRAEQVLLQDLQSISSPAHFPPHMQNR